MTLREIPVPKSRDLVSHNPWISALKTVSDPGIQDPGIPITSSEDMGQYRPYTSCTGHAWALSLLCITSNWHEGKHHCIDTCLHKFAVFFCIWLLMNTNEWINEWSELCIASIRHWLKQIHSYMLMIT